MILAGSRPKCLAGGGPLERRVRPPAGCEQPWCPRLTKRHLASHAAERGTKHCTFSSGAGDNGLTQVAAMHDISRAGQRLHIGLRISMLGVRLVSRAEHAE